MGRICSKRAMKASHSCCRENRKQPIQSNMLPPVVYAKKGIMAATLSGLQDSEVLAMSIWMANAAKTIASNMITEKKIGSVLPNRCEITDKTNQQKKSFPI